MTLSVRWVTYLRYFTTVLTNLRDSCILSLNKNHIYHNHDPLSVRGFSVGWPAFVEQFLKNQDSMLSSLFPAPLFLSLSGAKAVATPFLRLVEGVHVGKSRQKAKRLEIRLKNEMHCVTVTVRQLASSRL